MFVIRTESICTNSLFHVTLIVQLILSPQDSCLLPSTDRWAVRSPTSRRHKPCPVSSVTSKSRRKCLTTTTTPAKVMYPEMVVVWLWRWYELPNSGRRWLGRGWMWFFFFLFVLFCLCFMWLVCCGDVSRKLMMLVITGFHELCLCKLRNYVSFDFMFLRECSYSDNFCLHIKSN